MFAHNERRNTGPPQEVEPDMTQPSLPVLFLSDLVVLPGMVVPIALDEAAQAAVDAARASS